jgi:KDO2-lipid IV(A) lauroyltransferase
MSRILYYTLLKPLSYLPLPVLHRISDILFVLFYYLIGFRKKVVLGNMRRAFPERSAAEIEQLAKQFYQNLCDIIIESVRMFSISRAELLRRCPVVNPELFDTYMAQGRSTIIVAGHCHNWELAAVACGLQIPHQEVGIYHPLSDRFMDARLRHSRGRFGMELVATKNVAQFFENSQHRLTVTIFGADQSPSNPKRAYWTTFLNQDTGVLFGTEKYAVQYNYPVLFGKVSKLRRGYYQMEFEILSENPADTTYGTISELHTRALEAQILEDPAAWLWTHRRWKHQRPAHT